MTVLPPMSVPIACPSDESVWHSLSDHEWRTVKRAQTGSLDLWTLATTIQNGQSPRDCERISAFSLLAVISGQLCTICSRERLYLDIYDTYDATYIARGEQALTIFERLWRRHPRAEQSLTRLDDPLLNDCLSMLCSAYAHLYVGTELVTLKRIAEDPSCSLELPKCKNLLQTLKVVKYAANSWLVRAKIGIRYMSRAQGIELGPQALSAVYETALILAWWLHLYGNQMTDSGNPKHASGEERAAMTGLKRIFADILVEMEEQGSYSTHPGQPLDAISFYTSICREWVWQCSSVIEKRLQAFASCLEKRR
jgi:hypothetical protein